MALAIQGQPTAAASLSRPSPVEIRDGLFYKPGAPRALAMEALRMGLAAAIGERSGRFAVPKLQALDLPGHRLVLEYIPHLMDLHQVAAQPGQAKQQVFRAAGRALATVHQQLRLPADKRVPLPVYLRSVPEDDVALHGDFCWSNVGWQQVEAKLVLLDWAPAPLLGGVATFGCRYFDLVWFAWSLFFWMPPRRLLQWRPERLMRALAGGYAEVEGRFRWQRYVHYRQAMRSVSLQYWRAKQASTPSTPQAAWAHLLGWLRWRLFPSPGSNIQSGAGEVSAPGSERA